jgi:hypothetical protein
MTDARPKIEDYPDTPEGRHIWAQSMLRWNDLNGIRSDDLIKQWNEERRNAR